ncbi:hypothetical protein AAH450_06645 [Erwinia sp. P7711]|uniref:hypothetical protein n=1 Tax=Erwinia sp. P7711 TaxID=3141451 RepID=UPI003189EDC7
MVGEDGDPELLCLLLELHRLRIESREMARHNAAAGEPIYQLIDDSKWYDCKAYLYHEAKERGEECRIVYTAPQPAALPKEIPAAFYKVLYDECGGFVDCTADAAKIWAAFRKLAQGFTVEDDSDD